MNSLERAHTSCVMAQRLNNKAAEEIESGNYSRAIKKLNNALRLSRVDFREPQMSHILMLEACISHSQNVNVVEEDDEEEDSSDSSSASAGVIYQQTLRVPPQYISNPMGRILPLLIMYNMALANQLKSTKKETCPEEKRSLLNNALKLYQLAYQWQNNNHHDSKNNKGRHHHHSEQEPQEQNKSLRFNMILVNNIGDIHRCVNNRQKFQRCMQQLSRNMMYIHDNNMILPMETLFRRHIQMSSNGAAGAA